jgi:hypothetical protein
VSLQGTTPYITGFLFCFVFVVLEIELRVLCMLGKHLTTKIHPQASLQFLRNPMEHLLHGNFGASTLLFGGKPSLISKQPENRIREITLTVWQGAHRHLSIWQGCPQGVSPIPADCLTPTQFLLQVESKK